jgi:hypothetical protein
MVMDIGFFVALSLHCYLNTNIVIQNMHTYCSISLSNSMQFYPKIDEALRLLNNRFINYVGGIGNNVPLDLHMEHLNLMLNSLTCKLLQCFYLPASEQYGEYVIEFKSFHQNGNISETVA